MTPPRKPRKRKASRLVTTAFPRKPDLPPSIAGLRMPNSTQTLTAALDAQRERIDGIEARVRQQQQDLINLHGDFVMQRTRPSIAARVRAWWRA